jgi:hypothetical protein
VVADHGHHRTGRTASGHRVGLPAWPHLRRVESELVARIRQRLGADQFDQAFSVGSGLTQREAVAIVRDQRGIPAP